jgi:hypothetical protein
MLPKHPEDAAQVAPADEEQAVLRADRLEVVVEPAVGRVVGNDVESFAVAREGGADEVHAPDVHRADEHAPTVPARLVEDLDVVDVHQARHRLCRL